MMKRMQCWTSHLGSRLVELARWGVPLLFLSFIVSLSGCGRGPDRIVHVDGLEGPLSASTGDGGYALEAPKRFKDTWFGTFGSFLLCSSQPGAYIELEGVSWRSSADAPPRHVEPWIRVVDDRTPPALPARSTRGLPWNLSSEYPGKYSRQIEGRIIDQPCSELTEDSHPEVGAPRRYTELLLAIESDSNGAHVRELYIDYRAGGKAYRLVVKWNMITCGQVISTRPDDWLCQDT